MLRSKGKKKSAEKSLPKSRTLHGVEVKKAPIGHYVSVLRGLEELPDTILEDLFPGKSMQEIMETWTNADSSYATSLLARALTVLPEHIIDVLCGFIGVAPEYAKAELTPGEFMDIITAFWELNDMSDFFRRVVEMVRSGLLPRMTKTGSNT